MMTAERLELRGELRENETMARHTTWRAGGPAERWYRPADIDDLTLFLGSMAADEPLYWVGLGSNLLVRDGGIRGTVISTAGTLGRLEKRGRGRVRIEAGTACAKTARFCARADLAGAEFLAGIPGTIGGALAMNAGCFGSEIWERVVEVETIDRFGHRRTRSPADYRIGYRSVQGPAGEWFVAAELAFAAGDTEEATRQMRSYLDRRAANQPIGQPSAGSVFRNPEGDHAARLIEASGLKGTCIGGACVSDKHANFIINKGEASAGELEQLILRVVDRVREHSGVVLEPEVRIVGEPKVKG
ncbi:UDP-N-acetylmuramate dehydrogenase [Thiohalomonas denitrificans]|uniref:UDP-N-acetylmuramate dehydrogenase n=1 Tax=Thiohalomonas denitrificans TaxID=415747 RepID=UPI0026ECEDFC|nr:UDP-N-acetylmuramate dehydrogenase [Thiohalomonas denitrificans]